MEVEVEKEVEVEVRLEVEEELGGAHGGGTLAQCSVVQLSIVRLWPIMGSAVLCRAVQ